MSLEESERGPRGIWLRIMFDRDLPLADVPDICATFAEQLTEVLLEGAEDGGPWAYGKAKVWTVSAWPTLSQGAAVSEEHR